MPKARPPHVRTSHPAHPVSRGIADSTLLPSILSALKILPSHPPINFLLTMRAAHLHSVQKDCPTAMTTTLVISLPLGVNICLD